MTPRRPRDTFGLAGCAPTCPWCGASLAEATLTLEQVTEAHFAEALAWAPISPDGQAGPDALVCACPSCQRPSAIALQDVDHGDKTHGRWSRALAVRTAKDLEFLEGHPAHTGDQASSALSALRGSSPHFLAAILEEQSKAILGDAPHD